MFVCTWICRPEMVGAGQAVAEVEAQLERQLPEAVGTPCLGISALKGAGVERVMPAACAAYEIWAKRVPTAHLNRWLKEVCAPCVRFPSPKTYELSSHVRVTDVGCCAGLLGRCWRSTKEPHRAARRCASAT